MFLNNVRKNVKARIGVSIVLQVLSPISREATVVTWLQSVVLHWENEARQAGYLAGYISAEVGKFLKPVPVIFTFSERGKRVHSLQ